DGVRAESRPRGAQGTGGGGDGEPRRGTSDGRVPQDAGLIRRARGRAPDGSREPVQGRDRQRPAVQRGRGKETSAGGGQSSQVGLPGQRESRAPDATE